MKIALCGRGGTGKTTLAGELSRILALPLISEQVRVAARRLGIDDIRNMQVAERIVLQTAALCSQATMEELHSASGFVSDRSRFDYLAYYHNLLGGNMLGTGIGPYSALAHQGSYDLFVMVPPHSPTPEDDGFRFSGSTFKTIEDGVEEWLKHKLGEPLKYTVLTLRQTTVQGRVEEVLAAVKQIERIAE